MASHVTYSHSTHQHICTQVPVYTHRTHPHTSQTPHSTCNIDTHTQPHTMHMHHKHTYCIHTQATETDAHTAHMSYPHPATSHTTSMHTSTKTPHLYSPMHSHTPYHTKHSKHTGMYAQLYTHTIDVHSHTHTQPPHVHIGTHAPDTRVLFCTHTCVTH